jgi:protein required for attachment to host cells
LQELVALDDPKRATGAASGSWRKDTPLATRMRTSLRRSVLGTAWAKLIIISRPRNEKATGRSA